MNKWTAAGTFALVVGVLVLGLAYASSGVATAGNQIPCDATATPTQAPVGQIQAFQAAPPCTATATREATNTPVKIKTHTPTATATSVPKTPVPPTEPPATNTPKPKSENDAAAVKPPNTGTGDGTVSSDQSLWILMAGATLMVLGSGAALVGIRQRR